MSKPTNLPKFTFFGAKITSIISTSLVLLLLGLLVNLNLITRNLSNYVKENIGFTMILSDDVSDDDVKTFNNELACEPYVKSSDLFTKERALKELANELGENPREFLGTVPLMASIEVKLNANYANNDSLKVIEANLKQNKNVREIVYRKDLIQLVNDNMNKISIVLLTITLILLVISFILLNNTVRIHIYSERFTLRTMKLVGATHGFIRKPFLLDSIYSGLIAAVIAIAMLSGLLYVLTNQIEGLVDLLDTKSMMMTFLAIVLVGLILSFSTAYISLNRFLKMKVEKLYSNR